MFHGRKKVDKTNTVTAEELADIKKKLEKINRNNQVLLQKRKDKEYTKETLMQTEKFSFLSPDFTTLWNYRREILQYLFDQADLPSKMKMIGEELKFLVKGIMKSPKSYTLWFHRQWTLQKGLIFEKELPEVKMSSEILQNELLLCNKMLKQDERNFHCWNYKLWVIETFLEEHVLRGGIKEMTLEEIYEQDQKPLIEAECEMALALIMKNFSNFSAWHYRSKLMPKIHSRQGLSYDHTDYVIPLDTILKDFQQLKHAYFTDPKDQSPWNYHEWLLQQLRPIQMTAIELVQSDQATGELTINFELSQRVRRFDQVSLKITRQSTVAEEQQWIETVVQIGDQNKLDEIISNKWSVKVTLPEGADAAALGHLVRIQLQAIEKEKYDDKICFKSIEGVKLIRPAHIEVDLDTLKFQALKVDETVKGKQNYLLNLSKVIKEEFDNIKELTDFEEGLTYAQHRQLELNTFKYDYLFCPFYDTASEIQQFEDADLRTWASENAEKIHEVNKQLIGQLISQETSEINTRLFYEKVQKTFEERYKEFSDTKQSGLIRKV